MDTSKRFIIGSSQSSPRFAANRYSGQDDISNSYQAGKMRHESSFQRLQDNQIRVQDLVKGPDLSKNRLEQPEVAVTSFTGIGSNFEGEGQMANLDSLIEDFQKPTTI